MLRQYGRTLWALWTLVHVAMVAIVFAVLASRPELRGGAMPSSGIRTFKLSLLAIVATVVWPWAMSRMGIYQSQRREAIWTHVGHLITAHAIALPVLLAMVALADFGVSLRFPFVFAGALLMLQLAMHMPILLFLHGLRRSGRNYRNVLVIGAGPRARQAMETVKAHPEWGSHIIGFVDDGATGFTPAVPPERVYKHVDVPHILRQRVVDEVLVACPRAMLPSLAPIVDECATIGVPVTLLTDLFGDSLPRPQVGRLAHMSTLTFAPVHHSEIELMLKRALDVAGACVGLLIAAPIIGLAGLVIWATSGGPIFFRQIRCGRYGRRFEMMKLRTMVVDADKRKAELLHLNELDGPVFKIRRDPRVTPVGRFLRKWSIDELPQLINVLRGEMSLVGPRPPTPDEVAQYQGAERRRLSMRPGLTCLWQISGRNEIRFDDWVELDLEYIDDWSFLRDIVIILRTFPQVLLARGAS